MGHLPSRAERGGTMRHRNHLRFFRLVVSGLMLGALLAPSSADGAEVRQLTDTPSTRVTGPLPEFKLPALDAAGTELYINASTNSAGANPGNAYQVFRFDALTEAAQGRAGSSARREAVTAGRRRRSDAVCWAQGGVFRTNPSRSMKPRLPGSISRNTRSPVGQLHARQTSSANWTVTLAITSTPRLS